MLLNLSEKVDKKGVRKLRAKSVFMLEVADTTKTVLERVSEMTFRTASQIKMYRRKER